MQKLQWHGLIQALQPLPAHGILRFVETGAIFNQQLQRLQVDALTLLQLMESHLCGEGRLL